MQNKNLTHVDVHNQQYESKFNEKDIKHALAYSIQLFIIDNENTTEEDALNPQWE
jgi:hypothetical protein